MTKDYYETLSKGTSVDYPFLVTAAAAHTDLGVISICNKHLYRNMLDAGLPYPFTSQPYPTAPDGNQYLQQYIPGMAFNILGTNSDKQYFTGDIFEVLVFNQSLTTAERVKVESYLMSRYNVAKPAYSAGVRPPTSGLTLWLKADAGITKNAENKITEWKDQSGANRHATQTDLAHAPLFTTEGGRSMVSFRGKGVVVGHADEGKDSYLNCAVSAETYTVFGVMRKKDPQFLKWNGHHDEYSFWFGGQGHGLVAGGRSMFGGGTSQPLGWGIAWGETGWEGQYIGSVADTGWVVMTVNNHGIWRNGRSNMDITRIYRDVHMGVPKGPERDWMLPAINLTKLGGVPGTPWEHDADFLGDLAEVLIYDRLLLAPERGMVEDYLLTKYSLAAP